MPGKFTDVVTSTSTNLTHVEAFSEQTCSAP